MEEQIKHEPLPENVEWITEKIKVTKGARPEEWTGTDWWTKEDWDKFNAYVEELKAKGEYLDKIELEVSLPKGAFDIFKGGSDQPLTNFGFLIPNRYGNGYEDINKKSEAKKINESITLTGNNIFYSPKVTMGETKTITIPQPDTLCKPEHKVDGKVPFQTDIHFDGRNCDCGRVKFVSEECGCSIKAYRLKKYPNE